MPVDDDSVHRPTMTPSAAGSSVRPPDSERLASRSQDGSCVPQGTLYRVLAALLIVIAAALTLSHLGNFDPPNLQPAPRTIFGIRAGVGIGFVATLMDVGGGEVLTPTIVSL